MLPFQKQAWDFLNKKESGLILTGKGMNTLEIVKQFVIKYSHERKLVFVFGLSDSEKYKIIWECANAGVEFLPKDIEKDTGKKERQQSYSASNVYFHSPGILSKDFLQDTISPKIIDGIIIYNSENIHKDHGLQMCLAYYKSFNESGFIKAFSEKPYDMTDLTNSLDLLCVRYILIQPRFEENVKQSLTGCEMQIISISLHNDSENYSDFTPAICEDLTHAFDLLQSFFKAFISEYGGILGITTIDALTVPKRTLERRATNDKKMEVLQGILFFRMAYFILLHDNPATFSQFLEMKRPNPYNQPLWATYPQLTPLYRTAAKLAETSIPPPKLQWLVHLIHKFPKDKKILILADGTSTVNMIANYLSDFVPKTDSKSVEAPDIAMDIDDDEPRIDPTVFGVMQPPLVMLQEMHAQANVLEVFEPDYVIFWDISLLSVRRLEIYNSHVDKKVAAYLLCYPEAKEMEMMQNAANYENEVFIKIIQQLKSFTARDFVPFRFTDKQIIADDREFRSGMPNALLKIGFKVLPSMITVGDYVLTKDIVIERKAYSDLVQSLKSGRLLQQIQRMSQYYKRPMLMLEFSETDQYNVISSRDKSSAVMIKLSTIIKHFPNLRIIWGRNYLECAKTMKMLQEGGDPPVLSEAQEMGSGERSFSSMESKGLQFLSTIPFLTSSHIDKICENCKNLVKLLAVSRDDMMTMLGAQIGVKLYILLHSPPKQIASQ